MLDVQGWLACPGCGAWGGREPLCPRCGAVRGGRVPLDQSPGDGRWVLATRGASDEVLRALEVNPGVDPDVLERVAAARRILEALGDGPVSLWLDLRPAEAGHVARRTKGPNVTDTVFVLPWLLVRRGGVEARVVRTVHQKVKRSFIRGAGGPATTAGRLDEVVVLGDRGGLRRPVGRLERLAGIDWTALDADAPEPAPLPPTAPGVPGAVARAPVSAGLLSAALLLIGAPLLLLPVVPRDAAEVARQRDARLLDALTRPGPAPDAVDVTVALGAQGRNAARVAALAREPWTRANGVVAGAAILEPAERRRLLADAAQRDRDVDVRAIAIDLLAREGDIGATYIARLCRARDVDPELRAHALLALIDVDPARAASEACDQLTSVLPPGARLRRLCLLALGAPDAATRDPRRVRAVLGDAVEGEDDALCRARAAWALSGIAPVDSAAQQRVLTALTDTLTWPPPPPSPRAEAQRLLARSAVRAGLPAPTLMALAGHPGLTAPAARALRGASQR